jgi:hypothetical protein
MATFSSTNDITKPKTSKLFPHITENKAMSKEQREAIRNIGKMESNLASSVPEDTDTEMETAMQESIPWTEVKNKKDNKNENLESKDSTMKKVRVTLTIRSSKNSEFNPAKLHIETLHEIHKFDDSLIEFDYNGNNKVNIEATITESRYKEIFKPVEKAHRNGIFTVSISHYVYLTEKASACKEAIFPFIKKNKVFIYFNPKPGLEHFTAIGVLFGPNPDHTWRDELADILIETMRSEITQEETEKLGSTEDGKPKVLLSLNAQTIGTKKPETITSVALEIRVPTGLERTYTSIIERLYEKDEEEELLIPKKLGKFFPYYMKSKIPEVFAFLLRQQNADMQNTAILPIFGYTPAARKQQIEIDGEVTTVELALATTKNIIRIEATPSTWNLYKYLVVVNIKNKTSVQKAIQGIFRKITGPLENQPANFPVPRCGGREAVAAPEIVEDKNEMSAYMTKLETIALAQNPQDAGPSEPPKRQRKITISYASAVQAGILKQPATTDTSNENIATDKQKLDKDSSDTSGNMTSQRQVSWDSTTKDTSQSSGSSLSRSATTNPSSQSLKKDIDAEIAELKSNLKDRMDNQDKRISELIKVIQTMNRDIKNRMTNAILHTLAYEKAKVEEITHGRNYTPADAPLADENGILPCGAKAMAGGPLDRLHHVEITVQHMAAVLDTIAEHLQKDPTARHLFDDDDDDGSETPMVIIDQQRDKNSDNDVTMQTTRELSGIKRLHESGNSQIRPKTLPSDETSNNSSPQKSPPSKREKATISPTSTKPEEASARARGAS